MELLLSYWSHDELVTNGLILLHLLGSLAVGLCIGYERSYHGRAAGMRTYALVCVASCVLTVINGFPAHWFGGLTQTPVTADPTRVVQGIMTGIGFLGAGVIMKEGFTIRGLSTAASIWMTAAIGVTIGVGFYGAAISAAAISMVVMSGLRSVEHALPHQTVLHLTVRYARASAPSLETMRAGIAGLGYKPLDWTFVLSEAGTQVEYQFVLQAAGPRDTADLLAGLSDAADVLEFRLSPTRN